MRWLLDGLVGAGLGALAVVVWQLATQGGAGYWRVPAAVALSSFLIYPLSRGRTRIRRKP